MAGARAAARTPALLYALRPASVEQACLSRSRDRVSVQRLPDRHFAWQQHFNIEFATLVFDEQHVADADFARRLGLDFVGVDAAKVAGLLGERTGLEEARGP